MGLGLGKRWMNRGDIYIVILSVVSGNGGQDRITLKLYDWFLPALYQGGEDTPLLLEMDEINEETRLLKQSNLPKLQEAGWAHTRVMVH
jgi:hypothetical protein